MKLRFKVCFLIEKSEVFGEVLEIRNRNKVLETSLWLKRKQLLQSCTLKPVTVKSLHLKEFQF